jgi:hypothetical protein
MVELSPASLELKDASGVPSPELFEEMMDGLRYRFTDLTTRGSPDVRQWLNKKNRVVFEMRSPVVSELAALAVIMCRLRPNRIDYMYADGEHCIVYMMEW